MKVGIFLKSANHPRLERVLLDFYKGVSAAGNEAFLSDSYSYRPCDVAVIFGSWKTGDIPHHNLKRDVIAHAPNFIVVETPLIGRQKVQQVLQDDWFRIGLNGFLADEGIFHDGSLHEPNRWRLVSKSLDVKLADPVYERSGPILIALQLPGDASLRGVKIERWCLDTCQAVREVTDRPIVVRLPQLERQWDPDLREAGSVTGVTFQTGSFENLVPTLLASFCTVTYSSGLAIDSLISGCPTIAMDTGSFAYEIAPNNVAAVSGITLPRREQWLWDLAYCQWHSSEIEQGMPWVQLRELI